MKFYKGYSNLSVTRKTDLKKSSLRASEKTFVVLKISLEWYQASSKFVAYKTSFHPCSVDWPAGSH